MQPGISLQRGLAGTMRGRHSSSRCARLFPSQAVKTTPLIRYLQFMELFASAQDEQYGSKAIHYYRSMLFGVKSDAQGRGIGKALHQHTVNEMRRTSAGGFFFWSSTGNVSVVHRYKRRPMTDCSLLRLRCTSAWAARSSRPTSRREIPSLKDTRTAATHSSSWKPLFRRLVWSRILARTSSVSDVCEFRSAGSSEPSLGDIGAS